MSKKKKIQKEAGKTGWDVLDAIRPKNLKIHHYILIFTCICTLVAIYSGNEDGNLFFYIRVLATRLYQDQNILVAILIIICLILLTIVYILIDRIRYIYVPEIKRLKTKNKAKTIENQPQSTVIN